MCRPTASSTMTRARRRVLCRLTSTASAGGFTHLLMMKFMAGSSHQLTQDCRKETFHLGSSVAPQEDNTVGWVRQQHTVSLMYLELCIFFASHGTPRRERTYKN
ncbi:hypothetical protein BAE44_0020570 [Dichanthelium oligosanthes]|uniref:Uncharacterized protein n=1 Tax=Dichanthelium oligosanthes TaxID=888268 RepID=A0A1E5UZS2_9POAL|nr:hypothetical protein BAE44_0020570 [Dichanthelium oligosanthes]